MDFSEDFRFGADGFVPAALVATEEFSF